MSAKSKSYAEQISNAQVMSAALKANLEALERRGVTEDFINSLDNLLGSAIMQNSEQERLKATLKTAAAFYIVALYFHCGISVFLNCFI